MFKNGWSLVVEYFRFSSFIIIIFQGIIAKMRELPGLVQLTLGAPLVQHFEATPMITVSAHEFLFGYNDSFMSFVKGISKFAHKDLPFDKFGILAMVRFYL